MSSVSVEAVILGNMLGKLLISLLVSTFMSKWYPSWLKCLAESSRKMYTAVCDVLLGKSDPYCEVNMGLQEHKTKVIPGTLNPKWNASMQFTIKDLHQDVVCLTVYDRDLFTPNGRWY